MVGYGHIEMETEESINPILGNDGHSINKEFKIYKEVDGKKADITNDEELEGARIQILDKDGNVVGEAKIQTKKDINHGEDFWPSDLHFNGNIEALEKFVVENGLDYDLSQMVQNDEHVWVVADAVTGATLAGAPNYLRIAQEAAK
jgi:hypothetical protein